MSRPMTSAASLRIRDAALTDTPRIAEIYAHYVRTSVATFEEVPPDELEIAARFHRVSSFGLPWIVLEDEAGIQGYAYAGPFRDRSAYRFTVEDSIYIDADHLRCGYGTRLLGELISRCEALGKRQMIAVVGRFAIGGIDRSSYPHGLQTRRYAALGGVQIRQLGRLCPHDPPPWQRRFCAARLSQLNYCIAAFAADEPVTFRIDRRPQNPLN